jgi:hypothetical protein
MPETSDSTHIEQTATYSAIPTLRPPISHQKLHKLEKLTDNMFAEQIKLLCSLHSRPSEQLQKEFEKNLTDYLAEAKKIKLELQQEKLTAQEQDKLGFFATCSKEFDKILANPEIFDAGFIKNNLHKLKETLENSRSPELLSNHHLADNYVISQTSSTALQTAGRMAAQAMKIECVPTQQGFKLTNTLAPSQQAKFNNLLMQKLQELTIASKKTEEAENVNNNALGKTPTLIRA